MNSSIEKLEQLLEVLTANNAEVLQRIEQIKCQLIVLKWQTEIDEIEKREA